MKLVEQYRCHAFERRIALQHAGEHALGDHLDASAPTDACLETHAVTDRFADGFTERCRHACRHRARGEPARFEHDDLAAAQPRFIEQRNRHNGALAGAGWRFDDGIPLSLQNGAQLGQYFVDGQAGSHEACDLNRRALC